ncbi:MAG: 4-hydroxythreonine-4-phosphate dehydrogenase PdxA [Pseudomonadota bacterium]
MKKNVRIAVSYGEPAGIGPDICLSLSRYDWSCDLVVLGSRTVLEQRAQSLGMKVNLHPDTGEFASGGGALVVQDLVPSANVVPGELNPRNSNHVLEILKQGAVGCMEGDFDALVTAPVHKAVINDAGIPFSGHTEFLAEMCQAPLPVMMLATDDLRVALATTHLALRDVADAINADRLAQTLFVLEKDLQRMFDIHNPKIAVTGLNPHAGESGHLGREEIEVIEPTLSALRDKGMRLIGPVPADTLFIPSNLKDVDAVLAMYHDQGLPVIKALGFGHAVNVTLGLTFIRTSVDHGTALDLAGSGRADPESLVTATRLAHTLASTKHSHATSTA